MLRDATDSPHPQFWTLVNAYRGQFDGSLLLGIPLSELSKEELMAWICYLESRRSAWMRELNTDLDLFLGQRQ